MVPAVASLPPVPRPPVSAPLWCGDPRGSSGLHLKWELLCLCVPPRGFFPRPGYPQGVPTGSLDVGGRRNQGVIASATPPSLRPFGDRFHKVPSVSQLLMLVTSSIIHPFFVWGGGALSSCLVSSSHSFFSASQDGLPNKLSTPRSSLRL